MTEQQTTGPRIKILLVEDHALTRIGLKAVLKRAVDLEVIGEASNGREAISAAEELQPHVVLMDVGMPVMDGIQATREIVVTHPQIRVIILTQHDNERDIAAALAAGACGFCLKDVAPDRLYTAIRSVNAGDAWLDASIAVRILKHFTPGSPKTAEATSAAMIEPHATSNSQHTSVSGADFHRQFAEALSGRESEVLKLVVDGLSNQEIADRLWISLATAKSHVRNILNKLAVEDRTQAAVHAVRVGLV